MAKKIIGIVLVIAALLAVFLGIMAGNNDNQGIIENAVYLADGKVLPENEGKVVIITGKMDAPLPFIDKETGIALHSMINYRRVEKLGIHQETEDSREEWSWNTTVSENDYGGSKKVIAPGVTLGEFALTEELLQSISITSNRKTYDKKELNRAGWSQFEDDGKVYLYKGNYMPYEDELVGFDYLDYLDTLRVTYDEMSPEDTLEYTIIGMQKDGALRKAEGLDLRAAHPGKLTTQELLDYAASSAKTATITWIAISAVLAVLGILLILKRKRPAEEADENPEAWEDTEG